MSASNEPIIDRQALDRHTMGNVALQRELFILYFDQAPVYIDQLEESLTSGDAEGWRQAAHGIKGSSRALGFVRLAVLARECEVGGPNAEMIAQLREAVEETHANIDQEEAA